MSSSDLENIHRVERPLLSIQRNLDASFARHASSQIDLSPKLGVRTLDGKAFLLSLEDFDETMMTDDIMNVGRINPWVRGITSWRGRVFTIIDMSILLALESSSQKETSSNNGGAIFGSILHSKYDKNWALAWSGGTEGLVDVSKFKELEEAKQPNQEWISHVYEDDRKEKWYALDIERLLTIEKLSKVL